MGAYTGNFREAMARAKSLRKSSTRRFCSWVAAVAAASGVSRIENAAGIYRRRLSAAS